MATTTNYSWTTPDDTALVKDGAAAIRTLGSSADTTVKALNPGTTAGDIDYYTAATTKARVGIGTAGQVLAVNSGATAPEWKTISAGGMTLISTTSLSGASILLSSIPSTYVHLQLIIKNFAMTDRERVTIRMNDDSNASRHYWADTSNTANNNNILSYNATNFQVTGDADNAVTAGQTTINIFNYTDSTVRKLVSFISHSVSGVNTADFCALNGFGVYNQITAISSIRIANTGGNFSSGTALLYGVK